MTKRMQVLATIVVGLALAMVSVCAAAGASAPDRAPVGKPTSASVPWTAEQATRLHAFTIRALRRDTTLTPAMRDEFRSLASQASAAPGVGIQGLRDRLIGQSVMHPLAIYRDALVAFDAGSVNGANARRACEARLAAIGHLSPAAVRAGDRVVASAASRDSISAGSSSQALSRTILQGLIGNLEAAQARFDALLSRP